MSRASISTGNVDFSIKEDTENIKDRKFKGDTNTPMHIAVLANFSGNHARSELSKRKIIEVNKDNFDEVFTSMNVTLKLAIADQAISFRELDDLNPDFIYERVALFDQLRVLKRKLSKRETFSEAAAEISAWSSYKKNTQVSGTVAETPPESALGIPLPDNLLDAVLSGQSTEHLTNESPIGNIDQMIKDIISPYVSPAEDPRRADMIAAVDEATGDLLRKIMHHSEFQAIESSWRALYMVIRRLETSPKLKLFIIDADKDELSADLLSTADEDSPQLEDSNLFKLLVERQRTPGASPFSLIVGDYQLSDNDNDIGLAAIMASIARSTNASWITGGHERLAGCKSLEVQPDVSDWNHQPSEDVTSDWQLIRESEDAKHLALTAPRFLLRLPYGKKTAPVESIDFEELPQNNNHEYYLWGNSAFLVTLTLAQSFLANGWRFSPGQLNTVGELPLHIYQHDGESHIKPCAEVLLTDRAAGQFEQAGLMPIRSVKQREDIVISKFCSSNSTMIKGNWQ